MTHHLLIGIVLTLDSLAAIIMRIYINPVRGGSAHLNLKVMELIL